MKDDKVFTWQENVEIVIRDIHGNVIDTTGFHNQITDSALNWMAKALMCTSTHEPDLKYMAWGSNGSTTSTAHTTLVTETGRKVVTSQTSSGVGKCFTVCYISPSEGVGSIGELGWFAGSSATAVVNTGCMISRSTYTRVKTSLESLTVTRTDSFTT